MGTTTISVSESTLRRFNAERQSDQYEISQDAFVNELLDCWNDQLPDESDDANTDAEAIADELVARIDMTADPGTVMDDADVAELNEQVRKLQALVERVPEDTAEALGERFA